MKLVLCSIVECSVRFSIVRLFKCSISKSLIVFDRPSFWVSSIVFHCRTQWKWIERLEFDWVQLPNVRLTTPGKKHPYRKVRWQYFFVYLTKNWVLWQILIMSNVKAIISNHNKREFIVYPRALMKRERAAMLQQTQHLPHGWETVTFKIIYARLKSPHQPQQKHTLDFTTHHLKR